MYLTRPLTAYRMKFTADAANADPETAAPRWYGQQPL
jgi:hypothetical protein